MPRVERPRRFRCTVDKNCERRFGSDSDRARHERIHTGDRPFTCEICHKGFPQRTGLNTHRNIHTGAKPHSCSYCGQAFADPSSKARHEKETHRCAGTYKCPVAECPVGIKRRSAFVTHLKDKHGLSKHKVDIDACAPPMRPKISKKDQKKNMIQGATAGVSDKPGTPRLSMQSVSVRAPMTIPEAPSMIGASRMYDLSPESLSGKYGKSLEVKDDLPVWSEPRMKPPPSIWNYGSNGDGIVYADPIYNPPPSYAMATIRDVPQRSPYYTPFDPYSTPRSSTPVPHLGFSGSTDSSSQSSKILSTHGRTTIASSPLTMPLTHLVDTGSRPVSPSQALVNGVSAYYPDYYYNEKTPYFSGLYDNSPSAQGVHSTVQG